MAKAPQQPSEVFGLFIDNCKTIFATDLQSIFLFGSGARGEYQPKKSDINFIVVLSPEGLTYLKEVVPFLKKWRKYFISVPLFMTASYIQDSLDSYPMEFLDFKLHHLVVYGEDLLSGLQIKNADLRLQCEREIKGKLFHLRQSFITSGMNPKIMRQILINTIPTFKVIFESLLFLKNESVPNRRQEIFIKVAKVFAVDDSEFSTIFDLKTGRTRFNKKRLTELFERYIDTITQISIAVDKM